MPRRAPLPDMTPEELAQALDYLRDPDGRHRAAAEQKLIADRKARAAASREAWRRELDRRQAARVTEAEGAARLQRREAARAQARADRQQRSAEETAAKAAHLEKVPTARWRHPRRPGWTPPPDYYARARN